MIDHWSGVDRADDGTARTDKPTVRDQVALLLANQCKDLGLDGYCTCGWDDNTHVRQADFLADAGLLRDDNTTVQWSIKVASGRQFFTPRTLAGLPYVRDGDTVQYRNVGLWRNA